MKHPANVTGAVRFALACAEMPEMVSSLEEPTEESTNKYPDSCLVVTTCDPDSWKLTHRKSVRHGYPGRFEPDSFRECIDKVDPSVDETKVPNNDTEN